MSGVFHTVTVELTTGTVAAARDITGECEVFLREFGARDGLLNVFVPHATAGVAILETGAGSEDDLLAAIDELLPRDDRWRHSHGSPGHGRDHVLPGFIAPHATVPVVSGKAALGTWQSIVLIDTNVDNPRRQVRLTFVGA
ncbi:MAG: secondary thiamine-phosphate synthase enzyme YjbQ [Stackebrandtia sp.]